MTIVPSPFFKQVVHDDKFRLSMFGVLFRTQTKVFYNKVPKCGSRTMTELMGWMHKKRNFKIRSWPWVNHMHHLNHQQQVTKCTA